MGREDDCAETGQPRAVFSECGPTFVYLEPSVLRPLPQSLWNHACAWCDKRQSVWELFETERERAKRKGVPLCSLCWLYESEWGKEHREGIDKLIRAVEVTTECIFRKTADARLWSCQDADRILGPIAVTSRIAAQRKLIHRIGESDES